MLFRIVSMAILLFGIYLVGNEPVIALTAEEQQCKSHKDDRVRLEICTRLINRRPSDVQRAIYLNNRAYAYMNSNDCDRALSDFTEASRVWPHKHSDNDFYHDLRLRIGDVWQDCRGDSARAIEIFSEFIRDFPANPRGYAYRGQAKHEAKDFEGSLADLSKALELATNDDQRATALNSRGLVWRDMGQFDRALADYDGAIKIIGKESRYLANRGEIWRLKGNLERSLVELDRAVALAGKSPLPYTLRGHTLRYMGSFDRAIKDYQSALRLSSDDPSALAGLGLTYERMGNLGEAKRSFERAINVPSNRQATDISKASAETSRARLAALNSGEAPPKIPAAPVKATSETSVPTPSAAVPKPINQALTAATAKQGRRVALVIGNSAYRNVAPLANPQNDADAIEKSLRGIGFDNVTLIKDATREKLIDGLRAFANEAENSDWAMVYYAGHGIEVGGTNYLIPIDAKLAVDRDIEYEAVAVAQVLRAAASARKIKLVMLDACRVNPFKPRKTEVPEAVVASEPAAGRAIAARSTIGRGFARIEVAAGATLVVFAARDGQIALDGEGANSPFAIAVVQRIATPGVELNKIFRLVRDDVMEATAGRQEPYTYGSLPGKEDFYFVAK